MLFEISYNPSGEKMNYLGPEIKRGDAVNIRDLVLQRAQRMGIETVSIAVFSSDGIVIMSEGDESEAAEAKAKSALLQTQDTIMFKHTWNEVPTESQPHGWTRSDEPLLDEGDLAAIREKLESDFSLDGGGTIIKSEGGAGVIGAIGIVTGQSEITDHELSSLRPRLLVTA